MPQCGPFSIELRVWDRDALGGLAHERGATITDVRRDLDAAPVSISTGMVSECCPMVSRAMTG